MPSVIKKSKLYVIPSEIKFQAKSCPEELINELDTAPSSDRSSKGSMKRMIKDFDIWRSKFSDRSHSPLPGRKTFSHHQHNF